jgi:hypothetical protein
MDRDTSETNVAGDSPPSEAWLFAQAILGKPIPAIVNPKARAMAKRRELERLAQFSPRHAMELDKLRQAEAEARRDRELLQWAAKISTRAERQLRALQQEEASQAEAWRRAEQFCEAYSAIAIEWNEADHPRAPKGTHIGGQWIEKGGGSTGAPSASTAALKQLPPADAPTAPEAPAQGKGRQHSSTPDAKAKYLRDFDKNHDLTLRSAIKNGKLPVGSIPRIKFTDDEIKQILQSAEKPDSDFNLTFYTAENLPARLRATAERDFANLPGDEKYAMQAFVSNQRRARTILLVRSPAFQRYVGALYELLRGINPTHFAIEKGVVVATGKEPVTCPRFLVQGL